MNNYKIPHCVLPSRGSNNPVAKKKQARKLFTLYYQKSPHQYLMDIKIERAIDLFLKTNMMLSDIGELSGYKDSSSFIRAFKHKYKSTPERMRQCL